MKFFENAVEIKTSGGYHKEMIDDLIFMAKIHSETGRVKLAENLLLQGLNTARTFDLTESEGEIYNLLGEIFELSENYDEMNNYYNLALENYKDFGKDEKIVELIEKLAKIELKYFNNNEKSLHLEHDVLDIYRNQGYQKMIGETLMRISNLHLDLDDEKSAIECLTEARQIYENLLDEFTAELIKEKLNSLI
jgi:tetratricopeptide (TPR) repeat protein